ncbi:retrovirus-related pol polyprotein from transposon TNT 1-94 [Tanacetum coccineum]
MLPSTGRVSYTDANGSKPRSNTRNDKIPQPSCRSKKNKVKAQPRKSKSSLNKNNHVSDCNANLKNVALSKNSVKVSYLIVEIVLWYLDFGCSKHMTGHCDKLINFVSKFIGTVQFGNDHCAAIMGYGDLHIGNITISRVYYVEGLGHNLLSVRQFCNSDLEVYLAALCYPTNDFEDLVKLQSKADIGIFIGYLPSKKAYRIYNKRTRLIMESMNVQFDELTQMASEQHGSGLELQGLTSEHISSGLVQNQVASTSAKLLIKND